MFAKNTQPPDGWIFLSGHFNGTNKMLHDQRSAGAYQERRKQLPQWRSSYDRYAAEARRIRGLARDDLKHYHPVLLPLAWFGFALIGRCHHSLDPSAWYLPGKAAEDGLCDGGLITSDRGNVQGTAGTVAHSEQRSAQLWSWATARGWIPGTQGLLCMWWRVAP